MIKEILTYIREYSTPEARAFGHLYESISLIEKERRCHEAWRSHRDHSKQLIINECRSLPHFDHLLILGAGPMHEIPIEWLCEKFKKITLVDIIHLHQTKKKYAHFKNLEFINHDITEAEHVLLAHDRLSTKTPTFLTNEKFSLVISANVLSQLPLHFSSYIEKKRKKKFSPETIEHFLKSLTESHLKYLRSFNSRVILITDTEKYFLDKNGELIETEKNYTHLDLPQPIQEWMWSVAPIPEYDAEVEVKMKVSGFVIKKEAPNKH